MVSGQCTLPPYSTLHLAEPHCTTLHHTTPHCTTLHHIAPHCNTLQHTATHLKSSDKASGDCPICSKLFSSMRTLRTHPFDCLCRCVERCLFLSQTHTISSSTLHPLSLSSPLPLPLLLQLPVPLPLPFPLHLTLLLPLPLPLALALSHHSLFSLTE